jgi:hypothetical protein
MDQTVLNTDGSQDAVMGGNTFNLRVQDLTFGRDHVTTTQAHVTAVTNASLTLRTPKGFPTFDKILSNHTTKGADSSGASRFKMNAVTGDCELVAPTNVVGWPSKDKRQIGWNRGKPRHNLADDTWTLSETEGDLEHYAVGTLVGVKSQHGSGQSYGIHSGDNIAFESVRFIGHSRGARATSASTAAKSST